MIKTLLKPATEEEDMDYLSNGHTVQQWWPELKLNLDLQGVAADFYLFYAVKEGDRALKMAFNRYAQVVARQLAVYLDAAIGGELRHKNFAGMLDEDDRAIARRKWREGRTEQGIHLLKLGRNRFYNLKWPSGYGGPAWGKIADVLIAHLEGQMNPVLFVDQALALQHNMGCVFNKLYDYWRQDELQTVLNANLNEDWNTLINFSSGWSSTMFLSWLGSEDKLIVPGYKESKPSIIVLKDIYKAIPQFFVGQRVQINEKSHNKELVGKKGRIVEILQAYKTKKSSIYNRQKLVVQLRNRLVTITSANLTLLEKAKNGGKKAKRQKEETPKVDGKTAIYEYIQHG